MKGKIFLVCVMMLSCLASCSESKNDPAIMQEDPDANAGNVTRLSENPFHYFRETKQHLSYVDNKSFVMFYGKDREAIFSSLSANGIDCVKGSEYLTYVYWVESGPDLDRIRDSYWIEVNADPQLLSSIIPEAFYIVPLVINEYNMPFYLTNNVAVEYNGPISSLEEILKDYNIGILGRMSFENIFILWCTKDSKGNAWEIANKLHDLGIFKLSEPCFATFSVAANNL